MVTITTDVELYLSDIWENIDDEQFCDEAKSRGYHIFNINPDELLSLCRRDKREAIIEIERALGHDFIGLLTR